MICPGCGGILGRDCFNMDECTAISRAKAEDADMVNAELAGLAEQIRYWAYCTWQGMLKECPEKREELASFFSTLGITPYTEVLS